jgi:TonB-linked SusC/RagA family outer membrane protein
MKKKSHFFPPLSGRLTKLLILMKISFILLTVCTLTLSASVFPQSKKVTLELKDVTIREAFDAIEKQSGFKFFYINEQVDVNRKVSLTVSNEQIEEVLSSMFAASSVKYKVFENNLVVLSPNLESAQQIRVTGKVTDAQTGESLPGVNIVVKGTSIGVTTDLDGKFSIELPGADVSLVFSFIGYVSETVKYAGQANIDVLMIPDIQKLDEVVVVGYGTAKKKDVTGAISSLNEDKIKAMPVKDALQAMQGTTAGVDVTTNQRPGEVGTIKIRGVRSLTVDQNPLYVVDGMVIQSGGAAVTNNGITIQSGGIDNINPSDIESIDILKDASATAIYGSRGANGVVLVTTKHGKEGKVSLNYSGSVTISEMEDVTKYMNTSEWLDYARLAKYNMGTYKSATPSYAADYSMWGSKAASFANIAKGWNDDHTVWTGSNAGNYDWASHGKQTGVSTEHTLSASGGSDKFQGYGSFSYLKQDGTIVDQSYERYTAKVTLDITPAKWFKMGTSINASWADQNYGYNFTKSTTGSGDYYSALTGMLPWTVPYDANGAYIRNPAAGDVNIINPINETKYNTNQRQTLRVTGSFYSQLDFGEMWQPLKGLKYRFQFGPEFNYNRTGIFNDANGINGDGSNMATYNSFQTRAWTLDNLVYYDRTIANNHKIGVTLLQSASKYHYENSTMRSKVASSPELWYNMSSLGTISSYGSGLTENQLESYMVRANYSFKDKYLLTAAVRYDGASVLTEGNKWESFPSLALGWRMEQEQFMQNIHWIDALKLRLGYGITGNSGVVPYETQGILTPAYYNWGASTSTLGYVASDPSAASPTKMANPDVTWERTTQYNVGVDYGILNQRISGSIDAYKTHTDDLLMVMSIPSVLGYTTTWANVGKTKGWGIELQLNTINVKTRDFTWATNLTWSKDKSEIEELRSGSTQDITNSWFVGEEIGVFYDYEYDGIWKTTEKDQAKKYGRKPGQIRVKDLNGDSIIDANNDKKIVGYVRPDWTGGITNTFNYKNLEMSFFIYSRWGGKFRNGSLTLDGRYMQRKIDYWVAGTHEDAQYYSPGINGESADTYQTSMNYQDGTFVKLRYVTLGYNFSQKQLKKLGVKSLKVYAQCQNPFMIYSACDYLDTDQINYDNNTTTTGSPTTIKSLVFGVNVVF